MPEHDDIETGTGSPETKRGPGRPPNNPIMRQPDPAPIPDSPNWVTDDEAESFEQKMNQRYVRRKELKEGDNKNFFYMITALTPYNKLHQLSQDGQSYMDFRISKFHRNKYVKHNEFQEGRKAPKEVTANEEVRRYTFNSRTGNARVLDSDTDFTIDCREFDKVFAPDTMPK
jgi:hypothetical protein